MNLRISWAASLVPPAVSPTITSTRECALIAVSSALTQLVRPTAPPTSTTPTFPLARE